MDKIRTRFAPSPTGYLHIGGARTALFNWLFARKNHGSFILRIEDTDQLRSTKKYEKAIIDSLKWLGLNWDEGPLVGGKYGSYNQSQRLNIYKKYIEKLLKENKAYYCFCTAEELEKRRKEALANKQPPKYDGRCQYLSNREKEYLKNKGIKPAIRFKLKKEGKTSFFDLIKKEIIFNNELLDDFVILRSNGLPTYNFTVVIDDMLMEITHVLRGEDHISNTPKQILLYEALNAPYPYFAHFPLILGKDRTRLSKRHGAVALTYYQEEGYLPQAMRNYLALLGWAYDGKKEYFTLEELIKEFDLNKIATTSAIFDLEKLNWMNGNYLRAMNDDTLTNLIIPYFIKASYITEEESKKKYSFLKSIVIIFKDRLKKLKEIQELAEFFFVSKVKYEEKAKEKYLLVEDITNLFLKVINTFENMNNFFKIEIEKEIRKISLELKISISKIIHPLRVALTGRLIGPGLFELMEVLGKKKVIERLKTVILELKQQKGV